MAEAAAAGKRGPCCTLGSLAELSQVAMALAGGWAAAATEKGRAVVTVPMGGQHVLLAIRIDEYVRIGRAEAARFERPSKSASSYTAKRLGAVSVTDPTNRLLPSTRVAWCI